MTTDSRLTGTNILLGAIALSCVAQFLPFDNGRSYLVGATNTDYYTGIVLGGDSSTGWQRHPKAVVALVALAVAWLSPLRRNEHWWTWGPWLTVIGLFFAGTDSAPLRSTGGGLACAALLIGVWGAFRCRSERKAEEAAMAEARKVAAGERQA